MPGGPEIESGSLAIWTIYSCRAHNATSFVLVVLLSGQASLEEFWRFWEIEAAQFRTNELQVSCHIILHRIRVFVFGQGLYGGPYRGFCGCGPPSA
jgi:hypothetical protein